MKEVHDKESVREEKHKTLVRFLESTKMGEYVEITTGYGASGRLPDYTITDFEEEVYIFSYS